MLCENCGSEKWIPVGAQKGLPDKNGKSKILFYFVTCANCFTTKTCDEKFFKKIKEGKNEGEKSR